MNFTYKALLLASAAVLGGCGEEGSSSAPDTLPVNVLSGTGTQISFSSSLSPQELPRLDAQLSSVTPLAQTSHFRFSDVRFTSSGSDWQIENHTPQPAERLTVRTGDGSLALLVLDTPLAPYSQGTLHFPAVTLSKLTMEEQAALFLPVVQVSGFNANCSDTSKTCYDDLNATEREIYEVIAINIRNSFNRRSFTQFSEEFFGNSCASYTGCSGHPAGGLSYSWLSLLKMGFDGHQLGLKAMRNVYAAEGMGGGSSPDIAKITTTSGGWASLWEDYQDPSKSVYRNYAPITYDHLFHEIAHAYGFSHSSGMSYGLADNWGNNYAQQNFSDAQRRTRNPIQLPGIVMDKKVAEDGRLTVNFYQTGQAQSAIDLTLLSGEAQDVTLGYTSGSGQAELRFNTLPKQPVYLMASSESSDYFSTLRVRLSDLVVSKSWSFDGVKYTELNDVLLDPAANGWEIRGACDQPGSQLATKADYQKLWDHLAANNKLGELTKTRFLSRDEPSGYVIWLVEFLQSEMKGSHYGMTNPMGDDKGLVCVESLN